MKQDEHKTTRISGQPPNTNEPSLHSKVPAAFGNAMLSNRNLTCTVCLLSLSTSSPCIPQPHERHKRWGPPRVRKSNLRAAVFFWTKLEQLHGPLFRSRYSCTWPGPARSYQQHIAKRRNLYSRFRSKWKIGAVVHISRDIYLLDNSCDT